MKALFQFRLYQVSFHEQQVDAAVYLCQGLGYDVERYPDPHVSNVASLVKDGKEEAVGVIVFPYLKTLYRLQEFIHLFHRWPNREQVVAESRRQVHPQETDSVGKVEVHLAEVHRREPAVTLLELLIQGLPDLIAL